MKYTEIESLLKFMYQGEININQEDLSTFLKVAQTLQIRGLTAEDTNSTKSFPNCNNQLDVDSNIQDIDQSNLNTINETSKDVEMIDRRKRSRDITKKSTKRKKQDTSITPENTHGIPNEEVSNDNQEVLFLMNQDTNDILSEEDNTNIPTVKNNNDNSEDTTVLTDVENSRENSAQQGI